MNGLREDTKSDIEHIKCSNLVLFKGFAELFLTQKNKFDRCVNMPFRGAK